MHGYENRHGIEAPYVGTKKKKRIWISSIDPIITKDKIYSTCKNLFV